MYNKTTRYSSYLEKSGEIGFVREVFPPIIMVDGLPNVAINELVCFEDESLGVVTSLSDKGAEIMFLGEDMIAPGKKVTRTQEFLGIPVGDDFLGKSVDPLGVPLYDNVLIKDVKEHRPLESPASGISTRVKITEPLETGVTSVDLMVPLGKGQRELIIGDRKIGKTAFLYQTMITQVKKGAIVIYASIGKQKTSIKQLEEFINRSGIKDNIVIIASSASDPLGYIYLTPYSAITMAEYFRDMGRDVVVIFDDLTTHARYYREMSLIAKKFPGREAYPGDIFYAHARLLERGGLFKIGDKNVSITCLPVAETIEGDISGYIQTNLMSITDGHIFFDSDLFKQGHKPPINHFFSVTRVGRQTQSRLRWGVNRELVSFFTLFNTTQNFVHFGAELNEGIKATLQMGEKLSSFFNQSVEEIIPLKVQILFYCLVWLGAFSVDDNEKVANLMTGSASLYDKDAAFKEKIDTLVVDTEEFNMLLGKVSSQIKDLVSFLETANGKK